MLLALNDHNEAEYLSKLDRWEKPGGALCNIIALPGRNHLFLKHEPAAARFFEEINLFLTK